MPTKIEVSAKPVEKPTLTLPNVDEVNLRKLDWVLLTEDNFYAKVEEIKQSGQPVVFFALTDEGYEFLSLNLSDIRALVQQQQAIIAAYKSYYDEAEKTMDNAVVNE